MLNEKQAEIVNHESGPLLVLAVPGSGKTASVTSKIIKLLKSNTNPNHILAITFTNKAANEMKKRVLDKVTIESKKLNISTFHSFCAKILRIHCELLGFKSNYSIIDASDQKSIIQKKLKEINPKLEAKDFIQRIESKKNNFISDQDFKDSTDSVTWDVYTHYSNRLKSNNSMDFTDLIYNTLKLFKDYQEVADYYSNRFKYIFVDEVQDTNKVQMMLARILGRKHRNITLVGDNNQCIFSFRSANIQNIDDFMEEYTDTKIIKLEQNYRSTPEIIGKATKLIQNNSNGGLTTPWTSNTKGNEVKTTLYNNDEDEAYDIARKIINGRYDGKNCKDFAILYRTNYMSRIFEETFREKGIPYLLLGSFSFFDRKEIKSCLSYLKFINNNEDILAFSEAIGFPARGIGESTITKLIEYSESKKITILEACSECDSVKGINSNSKTSLKNFHKVISEWSDNFFVSFSNLIEKSGIIENLKISDKKNKEDRLDNVYELLRSIESYCLKNDNPNLNKYLQNIALMSNNDEKENEFDDDKVILMTIHSSKGLEFNTVFIPGMEEDIMPHYLSTTDREIEEERRLCYVAMTRAEKNLYLSHTKSRKKYKTVMKRVPSRFLKEM